MSSFKLSGSIEAGAIIGDGYISFDPNDSQPEIILSSTASRKRNRVAVGVHRIIAVVNPDDKKGSLAITVATSLQPQGCCRGRKRRRDPLSGRRELLAATDYIVKSSDRDGIERMALALRKSMHRVAQHYRRPNELRVFVNPVGGKRKALKILESLKPMFTNAGVKLNITKTNRVGHARELAETDALDGDGLMIVSGDGMVNEVINGLMKRSDKYDKPLGLIPAGSTNTVVWSSIGTDDITTCALRIILGYTSPMDIGMIYGPGIENFYITNFLGFGFFGDVIKHSEKYRWMGPARYTYSGAIKLLRGRSYETSVQWSGKSTSETEPATVKERKGKFKAVNAALLPCMTVESPRGMAPGAKLDDNTIHLIMIRSCWRLTFLKFLSRITTKADQYALSAVEYVPCSEMTIKPTSKNMHWNCDGELKYMPLVNLKIEPSVVRLFTPSTDMHEFEENSKPNMQPERISSSHARLVKQTLL